MPSKKSEGNKSSATGTKATGVRAKATESEAKPVSRKPKAAKSKTAAAAANGDSILNLSAAVNGKVTPEQVAERAYFRWIERGCPVGTAEEDWFGAEQELGVGR